MKHAIRRSWLKLVPMSSSHRKAVPIDVVAGVSALALLPFSLLAKYQKEKTFYPRKCFKRVPDWPKAVNAVACVSLLLEASFGHSILHVSMRAAVQEWCRREELGLDYNKIDDIAYSLRAIINQMYHMKVKTRCVPAKWRPKFAVVFGKVNVEAEVRAQLSGASLTGNALELISISGSCDDSVLGQQDESVAAYI